MYKENPFLQKFLQKKSADTGKFEAQRYLIYR